MNTQSEQEYIHMLLTKLLELLIVFIIVGTIYVVKQMFESYHIWQLIKPCLYSGISNHSMVKDVTLIKQTVKICTKKLKIKIKNNKEHYTPHYEGISGTTGLICACGQCELKAITNYEIHALARPFQPNHNQRVKCIWVAKFEAAEMEKELATIVVGPTLFRTLHPPQIPQPIVEPTL